MKLEPRVITALGEKIWVYFFIFIFIPGGVIFISGIFYLAWWVNWGAGIR